MLVPTAPRKSIGADVNYGIRFPNMEQAESFISELCNEVATRMLEMQVKANFVVLKIRKRSPDAPIDPPKFMGCGRCDAVNK